MIFARALCSWSAVGVRMGLLLSFTSVFGAVACGLGGTNCDLVADYDTIGVQLSGLASFKPLSLPATVVLCTDESPCVTAKLAAPDGSGATSCGFAEVDNICCDVDTSDAIWCSPGSSDGFEITLQYDTGTLGNGPHALRVTIHTGDAKGPVIFDELRAVLDVVAWQHCGNPGSSDSVTFTVAAAP
jgi:hypothetical protein